MTTTGAGGRLAFRYRHPLGEQHTIHLHTAHFDSAPITTTFGVNDRAYISGGPVLPSEGSVLETCQALAALWQPYYGAHWTLDLVELKQVVDDTYVYLDNQPAPAGVPGTNADDDDTGPRINRKFRLVTPTGMVRHFYLNQVRELVEPRNDLEVTASTGGLDARDQAIMAYLSGGSGGGAVMPDGVYCFPVTTLDFFWASPLPVAAGGASSAVDAAGAVAVDCLTFPRGATLCNGADGQVQIAVPSGVFTFDSTGITLPGGHRLDAVTG